MGKKAVSAGALLLLSVFLMAAGCGSSQQSDSSYQTAFPEPVYDWGKSNAGDLGNLSGDGAKLYCKGL